MDAGCVKEVEQRDWELVGFGANAMGASAELNIENLAIKYVAKCLIHLCVFLFSP